MLKISHVHTRICYARHEAVPFVVGAELGLDWVLGIDGGKLIWRGAVALLREEYCGFHGMWP